MGVVMALMAAVLFGTTVPLSKMLLESLPPLALVALLYGGCGVGLAVVIAVRWVAGVRPRFMAQHWVPFAFSLLSGGIVAPILFVTGLAKTSAASAALMLNLEVVFTVILARFVLREAVGGKRLIGMIFVIVAAASLSSATHAFSSFSWRIGNVFIAGAALGWAIDNILTRRIADSDVLVIASMKGLVAGLVDFAILYGRAGRFVIPWAPGLAALLVGFVGYGFSLGLFIRALRTIGVARASSYFASAPFVGALLGAAFGQTPVTIMLEVGFAGTLLGIVLMTIEPRPGEHRHWHRHDGEHSHIHTHPFSPQILGWHWHNHNHSILHGHRD
ncbi:MAG: DMT family transporter [Acidiferrobacter sp.]